MGIHQPFNKYEYKTDDERGVEYVDETGESSVFRFDEKEYRNDARVEVYDGDGELVFSLSRKHPDTSGKSYGNKCWVQDADGKVIGGVDGGHRPFKYEKEILDADENTIATAKNANGPLSRFVHNISAGFIGSLPVEVEEQSSDRVVAEITAQKLMLPYTIKISRHCDHQKLITAFAVGIHMVERYTMRTQRNKSAH